MNKDLYTELTELNSSLRDFSRAIPYPVPDGYFEDNLIAFSPQKLLAYEEDLPTAFSKDFPLFVEDSYFRDFPDHLAELIAAEGAEPSFKLEHPFTAPDSYFENFAAGITELAAAGDDELSFQTNQPFAVPDGYFDEFAESSVFLSKEEDPSTMHLPKGLPYAVPEGYFAQFPAKVLAILKAENKSIVANSPVRKSARLIPLLRPLRAVAATLLLATAGFGVYQVVHDRLVPDGATQIPAADQIAMLSKKEIQTYMNQNVDDFDSELLLESVAQAPKVNTLELDGVSKQDIMNYLSEGG